MLLLKWFIIFFYMSYYYTTKHKTLSYSLMEFSWKTTRFLSLVETWKNHLSHFKDFIPFQSHLTNFYWMMMKVFELRSIAMFPFKIIHLYSNFQDFCLKNTNKPYLIKFLLKNLHLKNYISTTEERERDHNSIS
jgi:hypothetical protein